jgi:cytochrome c553
MPMNLFCLVLGHTWVPGAENPKTSWNADSSGHVLNATPSASPRFYEECARCHQRRAVAPTQPPGSAAPQRRL